MRRTRASLTAVAAVAAVVLAACGTADTTGGGGASGGGAAAGSEEAARNGTADGAARGGTLNMLGTGDVDYMDPNVTYYSAGLHRGPALEPAAVRPTRPTRRRRTRPCPTSPTSCPTTDNGGISADGKTYTHHHQAGRAVEHQPAAPGDGGRRGARRQAHLQPGPAVRRPAGLPGPHRGLQAVLRRVRQGRARTPPSIKKYIEATPLPGVVAKDDRTVVFTLTSPGHVLRRHAHAAGASRPPRSRTSTTCRAAPSSAST